MIITSKELKQLTFDKTDFNALENAINKSIIENHGEYPWEEALLDEELSVSVRKELCKRAIKSGWNYIYHITSSENDERPGLTLFIFSKTSVDCFENNSKYHKGHREL